MARKQLAVPDEYSEFIRNKHIRAKQVGITPTSLLNPKLFDFQAKAVEYLLKKGRGAAFLDTGLGKTVIELEFCDKCIEVTNKPALLLTALAISAQIKAEATKFGYTANVISDMSDVKLGINICNYDRIHKFNFSAFGAISLDESSILKNFAGATAQALVQAGSVIPYRLCASATPAPNDYTELGMHAEFLGLMTINEMLSRWFTNDRGETAVWRLKKHATNSFWDWVASWAVMAEKPSDIGFSDKGYDLPELIIEKNKSSIVPPVVKGSYGFFSTLSVTNMHNVKRSTIDNRASIVNEIVRKEPDEAWVIWCDTDYEADALCKLLPEALDVRGKHSPDIKEKRLVQFASKPGQWIITKPSIAGFGLNWQHCARMIFVGRTFSYETWYQAVRRCWRFGQTRVVVVHLVFADGEKHIDAIVNMKSGKHTTMKVEMREASKRALGSLVYDKEAATLIEGELPAWL